MLSNLKAFFSLSKLELKKTALSAGRAFIGATLVFVTPIADEVAQGLGAEDFDLPALKGLVLAAASAGAIAVVRLLQAKLTRLEPTK